MENGESVLFWFDCWNGAALENSTPELFSFAKNKMISVKKALEHEQLSDLLQLPISQTAMNQLLNVQQSIAERTLSLCNDSWSFS